ncbi:KAP family P-loop domain protein [Clavibacter michiganensis]|uniref:KAP family P-loop domain protein n=2 Tax=Clavibacter michiganensis TaxID=28447 RepID=A0A251YB56_9MICO|nr:KAP family P-loop domain protein [Clavibacter michiganensis]
MTWHGRNVTSFRVARVDCPTLTLVCAILRQRGISTREKAHSTSAIYDDIVASVRRRFEDEPERGRMTSVKSNQGDLVLWSDEPATTDLLSFDAIAETVVDALFDESLNPVALGISGAWGSGKTTVLNLIDRHVEERSIASASTVIVVRADPWRYDPTVGPKESLIAAVLKSLQDEFKGEDVVVQTATAAFKRLAKRVNWSKAIKMTATTALTAQLPSLDAVMGLVSDEPETLESDKGMDAFREEFQGLLNEPALGHVSQVVVLVDDLDRCLPDTVVDTLEAIRLFLSAKGMSFVIAADEVRVAEAIQQKIKAPVAPTETESTASLYLHKIVQTTIPVPALSHFDTRAYLFLLLSRTELDADGYSSLVRDCAILRTAAGSLDDLSLPGEVDLSLQMATASRLTPILYEKFHGNPRRIKRFMNDLYVRQTVAGRRGIQLEPEAIAKLMVIEKLLEKDFDDLLKWQAAGQLRQQLDALQRVAIGEAKFEAKTTTKAEVKSDTTDKRAGAKPAETSTDADSFSGTMVRWAKLPPTLDASSVTGYLTLAAAFKGRLLVDESLSEKLRDLAAALTSNSQVDRNVVKEEELERLPAGDVVELLAYLGRRMQDDPTLQLAAVNAIVTIASLHPGELKEARSALAKLPSQELKASTVLVLKSKANDFVAVLDSWVSNSDSAATKAIASIRKGN